MGLSEEEKDRKVDGLVEHVKRVKSARGESQPNPRRARACSSAAKAGLKTKQLPQC
jgi:hypothetical protein